MLGFCLAQFANPGDFQRPFIGCGEGGPGGRLDWPCKWPQQREPWPTDSRTGFLLHVHTVSLTSGVGCSQGGGQHRWLWAKLVLSVKDHLWLSVSVTDRWTKSGPKAWAEEDSRYVGPLWEQKGMILEEFGLPHLWWLSCWSRQILTLQTYLSFSVS